MPGKEAIRKVLGAGRPVFEHLPVDPRWTFAEAMEILTHRHEPRSMLHNQGRNRLMEAWATMVGGRRATEELSRTIASYGSMNATAKALRTSKATLEDFRRIFAALPEPHEIAPGYGVILIFVGTLGHVERTVVEAIKATVLKEDTAVHLARYEEIAGGSLLRFEGGSLSEMETLAGALVGWTWADPDSLADERTARLAALLEEIRERLVRVEVRMPNADVQEWMNDQALDHLARKDRELVQTRGQKLAKLGATVASKKLADAVDELIRLPGGKNDGEG